MTNIGEVIGWKFNHQSGMSTREGVITEFPGGIPTQAEQDLWTAEYETAFPARQAVWRQQMADNDRVLPRWAEDMHDALPQASKDGSSPALQSKVAQKKLLRQSKPI